MLATHGRVNIYDARCKSTLTIVDSGGRETVIGRVPKETAQDAVTLINELCSPTQERG